MSNLRMHWKGVLLVILVLICYLQMDRFQTRCYIVKENRHNSSADVPLLLSSISFKHLSLRIVYSSDECPTLSLVLTRTKGHDHPFFRGNFFWRYQEICTGILKFDYMIEQKRRYLITLNFDLFISTPDWVYHHSFSSSSWDTWIWRVKKLSRTRHFEKSYYEPMMPRLLDVHRLTFHRFYITTNMNMVFIVKYI